MSRLLKMIGLFCRILSLLWVSFAKETYHFKEPTNRSHPICKAVCCSMLQCVTVCCSVSIKVCLAHRLLQCVTVCCSHFQCVAARVSKSSLTNSCHTQDVKNLLPILQTDTRWMAVQSFLWHRNALQHTAPQCGLLLRWQPGHSHRAMAREGGGGTRPRHRERDRDRGRGRGRGRRRSQNTVVAMNGSYVCSSFAPTLLCTARCTAARCKNTASHCNTLTSRILLLPRKKRCAEQPCPHTTAHCLALLCT